jgi:glycosyltransferase involved in cell wall biosynthesis
MSIPLPSKILISGGMPAGGIASFAEGLHCGFAALGIPSEVIQPTRILARQRDLRNPDVLKILSTTAVFVTPFSRRTICVAHGFPRADVQGWIKLLGIITTYKLANRSALLVAVSHYTALHLRTIFGLRVDAVIHNPLGAPFMEDLCGEEPQREYITYVGRLHPSKRLDIIFPAIRSLVEEVPDLRACIIGDGELRGALEEAAQGNSRIEFKGPLPPIEVRGWLRRTKVFVSGCETEAFGLTYL